MPRIKFSPDQWLPSFPRLQQGSYNQRLATGDMTSNSGNTMPNSHSFGVADEDDEDDLSHTPTIAWAPSSQPMTEGVDQSVPIHIDIDMMEPMGSKSQDAASSVRTDRDGGKGRKDYDGPPGSKDPSSTTTVVEGNLNPTRVVHTEPQRARTRYSKTFSPCNHTGRKVAKSASIAICDETIKSPDDEDEGRAIREPEGIERVQRGLSDSYLQLAKLRKRREAQSRDTKSTNNIHDATDKSSDSDVIHDLQGLNAEIQFSTTHIANCLMEDFELQNLTAKPTGAQISAVQGASQAIGQALAESLGTKTSEYTPMLLQIAFQAYLVFTFSQARVLGPSRNRFITSIYQSLRRVGAQSDSGRWRSLARHSNHNYPESLVTGIIVGFTDILLAAGCTAPQSDIISRIASKLKRRIARLVELAGRLNKIVGEVGSNDLEILVVLPGEKFESKYMEYVDGEEDGVQDAIVLCATQFGLKKRIPVGMLWEKGKKQEMVVFKAKVTLQSFLNSEG